MYRLGFCGADDYTNIDDMLSLSQTCPDIEWGVLFHSFKSGVPRYPTMHWVERLCHKLAGHAHLAAHFCGPYVNDLLCGDVVFLNKIANLGFERVQINPTKANDVFLETIPNAAAQLGQVIKHYPDLEFLLQRNTETEDLCLDLEKLQLPNLAFLNDASCGQGVYDPDAIAQTHLGSLVTRAGFAGGFCPENISEVVQQVKTKFGERKTKLTWIDMESGVRENGRFSLARCADCVRSYLSQV
jgi:hypothetical protein